MDGLIVLNKPAGITSAKALYRVRRLTGQKKSGHAGTLDPAATGVLLLCLGKATRLVELIMDQPKVYQATARLDVTSESFDSDRPLQAVEVSTQPTGIELENALQVFAGQIQQVPPRISAIKVGGVPSYKLQRTGASVELAARTVHVYSISLRHFAWPTIGFEMCCGRGTYVRSIIRDVGVALGTGGCLTGLQRLRIGPFGIEDSWTLDALRDASPADYIIPLERAKEFLNQPITVPSNPH